MTPFRMLLYKEFREFHPYFWAGYIGAILYYFSLYYSDSGERGNIMSQNIIVGTIGGLYAFVISLLTLYQEVQKKSIELLWRLPVSPIKIYWAKSLYLFATTILLHVVIWITGFLFFPGGGMVREFFYLSEYLPFYLLFLGVLIETVMFVSIFAVTQFRYGSGIFFLSLCFVLLFVVLNTYLQDKAWTTDLLIGMGTGIFLLLSVINPLYVRSWFYRYELFFRENESEGGNEFIDKTDNHSLDRESSPITKPPYGEWRTLWHFAFRQNKFMFIFSVTSFLILNLLLLSIILSISHCTPTSDSLFGFDFQYIYIYFMVIYFDLLICLVIQCYISSSVWTQNKYGTLLQNPFEMINRLGVSPIKYYWSRLLVFGGIYTINLLIFLLTLGFSFYLLSHNTELVNSFFKGSDIGTTFDQKFLAKTGIVFSWNPYCILTIVFGLITLFYLPFALLQNITLLFMQHKKRDIRIVELLLVVLLILVICSFFPVYIVFYYTGIYFASDYYNPFYLELPLLLFFFVLSWFLLKEQIRFRLSILKTTGILLIGFLFWSLLLFIVHPFMQIRAIPEVPEITSDQLEVTMKPVTLDKFRQHFWLEHSLDLKSHSKETPLDLSELEVCWEQTVEEMKNPETYLCSEFTFYTEAYIAGVMDYCSAEWNAETLRRGITLLERIPQTRPLLVRQLDNIYRIKYQFSQTDCKNIIGDYNSSYEKQKKWQNHYRGESLLPPVLPCEEEFWWRNVRYRKYIGNERKTLTPLLQYAQRTIYGDTHSFKEAEYDSFEEPYRQYCLNYDTSFSKTSLVSGRTELFKDIVTIETYRRMILLQLKIHLYRLCCHSEPNSFDDLLREGLIKEIPTAPGTKDPFQWGRKLDQPVEVQYTQKDYLKETKTYQEKTITAYCFWQLDRKIPLLIDLPRMTWEDSGMNLPLKYAWRKYWAKGTEWYSEVPYIVIDSKTNRFVRFTFLVD